MNMMNTSSGGMLLPGSGLVNPAFVIQILSANDDLEQPKSKSRGNPDNDFLDNLECGDTVFAKKGKENVEGKIQRIIKNSLGDVTFVIISDKEGRKHRLEATTVKKERPQEVTHDEEAATSSPAIFNENRFKSFSQFIND